jgi:putative phage-type endonuclease
VNQIIPFTNEQDWLQLRTEDLTSTDIAALFGLSPYCTPYELWFRKKDKTIVKLEDTDRLKWGRRNQDTIAHGFAEDQGWSVRKMTEYIRKPELRLGSSFDFMRIIPSPAIIEVKNIDGLVYKNEWIEDDNGIQAPYHIELQIQQQLLVSELTEGFICALVGGNKPVLIHRKVDEKIQQVILKKSAEFWKSIDENKPPEPNFEVDSEFIKTLYQTATPGTVIDISENKHIIELVTAYRAYKDTIKLAETRSEGIKAELLTLIGTNEKAIAPTFSISASIVKATHIEYDRAEYRTFKINYKKEK